MIQPDYRSVRPLKEQIKEGIRKTVITHAILEGERLPSVQKLASKLAVNPRVIEQAYRELEEEGYVCSVEGEGIFAASGKGMEEHCRKKLLQEFDSVVVKLSGFSVGQEELIRRVAELTRGDREFD